MTDFTTFVGIDVGKFELAVFISEPPIYFEVPNTPQGHKKLIEKVSDGVADPSSTLLALEPTGGYE